MKKQKDAVFEIVTEVLKENNIQFEPRQHDAKELITKPIKGQIVSRLIRGFELETIKLGKTKKTLTEYSSNLLSNWLRKDERLNGGIKTSAERKQKKEVDSMVKNLKILQSTVPHGSEEYQVIQQKINERMAEIHEH